MATGGNRGSREARERTRVYQARQAFRQGQAPSPHPRQLIAAIAGGLLILGVVAAQTAYFVAGPGAPEPSPSATPIPTITSTPLPADPRPTSTSVPTPDARLPERGHQPGPSTQPY